MKALLTVAIVLILLCPIYFEEWVGRHPRKH